MLGGSQQVASSRHAELVVRRRAAVPGMVPDAGLACGRHLKLGVVIAEGREGPRVLHSLPGVIHRVPQLLSHVVAPAHWQLAGTPGALMPSPLLIDVLQMTQKRCLLVQHRSEGLHPKCAVLKMLFARIRYEIKRKRKAQYF